jgi:tellurite methyltransferase
MMVSSSVLPDTWNGTAVHVLTSGADWCKTAAMPADKPHVAQPTRDGGYDDGYRACPCFWGATPGSVLRWLGTRVDLHGSRVLDLGCGEGKNAVWLEGLGCTVTAVDVSGMAISNAKRAFPESRVTWNVADAAAFEISESSWDLIVAYGLLHCLKKQEISQILDRIQNGVRPSGYNVVVTFNDRSQDLAGHPGFRPTLLAHEWYAEKYSTWECLYLTDEDLHETHPHNNIPHSHSMTRIAARKP